MAPTTDSGGDTTTGPAQAPSRVDDILTARYHELFGAVSQFVGEMLSVDVDTLQPSSMLLDLGAQSFDFVDLVFRLERRFEIDMPRSFLLPDNYTVDAIVRAVASQLARRTDGDSAAGRTDAQGVSA
jgi:acyl carrier protein